METLAKHVYHCAPIGQRADGRPVYPIGGGSVSMLHSHNASTTTTNTAVSVVLPTSGTWTFAVGDTIYLWVSSTVSSTIPTPTGSTWTVLQAKFGTTPCAALFGRPAVAADVGATISLTLGTAGSWTAMALVVAGGQYAVDTGSTKNGTTASTAGSFSGINSAVTSALGAIGVEFFTGLPASGQTDTLTVPTGYGNSDAVASTKATSVNTSSMICTSTTASIVTDFNAGYTPPTVTQSVSVKYVNAYLHLIPVPVIGAPVVQTGLANAQVLNNNGFVVDLPALPTVGNTLIMFVSSGTGNAMMPVNPGSLGFTLGPQIVAQSGNNAGAIYYKYVASGDPMHYNFGGISDLSAGILLEVSGLVVPDTAIPSWATATSTGPAANAITPTGSSDLALTFFSTNGEIGASAAGTPWSSFVYVLGAGRFHGYGFATDINPPAGTALNSNWTATFQGTPTTGWTATTILFKTGPPVIRVTGAEANGSTSCTPAVPAGITAAGQLQLGYIWAYYHTATVAPTDANVTLPSGYAIYASDVQADVNGGYNYQAIVWHYSAGAESGTKSFSWSSTDAAATTCGGIIARVDNYTGTSGNPFVDTVQVADNNGSNVTSVTYSTFTPGGVDSMFFIGSLAGGTTTYPPSVFQDGANSSEGDAVGHMNWPAAAAVGSAIVITGSSAVTMYSILGTIRNPSGAVTQVRAPVIVNRAVIMRASTR